VPEALYDRIGRTYAERRRADVRIAALVDDALGPAATVLDVGCGAGSYETGDHRYVAVDPSRVMLDQRGASAGPAVAGVAEALPFPDAAFDAALAILTIHHWTDAAAGLAEVRRVTRGRIVVMTWEADRFADFWLVKDYLPESGELDYSFIDAAGIRALLGPCRTVGVPVPADCTDGFFAAYWRRPEAYLAEDVRAAISNLALLDPGAIERMVSGLSKDLASGEWQRRHADLLEMTSYDAGYRLLIAEPTIKARAPRAGA
jgi:SAM-dependent methyltransferase